MGFAPNGLKVGDIYESDGVKKRVLRVDETPAYTGYITEIVEDDDDDLCGLPFVEVGSETGSDEEEKPRKRATTTTRKRTVKK